MINLDRQTLGPGGGPESQVDALEDSPCSRPGEDCTNAMPTTWCGHPWVLRRAYAHGQLAGLTDATVFSPFDANVRAGVFARSHWLIQAKCPSRTLYGSRCSNLRTASTAGGLKLRLPPNGCGRFFLGLYVQIHITTGNRTNDTFRMPRE